MQKNQGRPCRQAPRNPKTWRALGSATTPQFKQDPNHVDIEPLGDLFWKMKAKLYELEPPRSAENLPTILRFYKPQKYYGGFYLY